MAPLLSRIPHYGRCRTRAQATELLLSTHENLYIHDGQQLAKLEKDVEKFLHDNVFRQKVESKDPVSGTGESTEELPESNAPSKANETSLEEYDSTAREMV